MEWMVRANGISICCEGFGNPDSPAILLIAALGNQGVGGPAWMCERLAAAGRYVLRYDARDTGKSTCFDFEQHPYTLADMAADAVGLLDALDIRAAHIVGRSMGGMVAQEIAINHPERALTLTSMMSTPSVFDPTSPTRYSGGLPAAASWVQMIWAELADRPAVTRQEWIDAAIQYLRVIMASGDFDRHAARREQERQFARASNISASANHRYAIAASGDRTKLLAAVNIPALIVHGSDDPVFPSEHGVATANAIPRATLHLESGMGHDFSDAGLFADRISRAIIEHTAERTLPTLNTQRRTFKFF